jgi:hypothetical protein
LGPSLSISELVESQESRADLGDEGEDDEIGGARPKDKTDPRARDRARVNDDGDLDNAQDEMDEDDNNALPDPNPHCDHSRTDWKDGEARGCGTK